MPPCCCPQGLVATLHEGDDFGQLALVNDAPRAATILLREDNCHFLRVDKHDFNRILKVAPREGGLGSRPVLGGIFGNAGRAFPKFPQNPPGRGGQHGAAEGARQGGAGVAEGPAGSWQRPGGLSEEQQVTLCAPGGG